MIRKKISQHGILEHLLVLGMAAMCLMVFGNVILRYVFDTGLQFSEEVSRFVFVWLTFIGSIVALKDGIHLGVDSLLRRLPARPRMVCYWISHILMLWCCWLLWTGSWEQTRLNLHNLAPVSGIPIAMMYGSGLVASALMAPILLKNLWKTVRGGSAISAHVDTGRSADVQLTKEGKG
ncbi:TRAP transporter small permease [Pusillimonas sp. ANT_WB101]|uniref:TRAP transporter small permease n=1 Tax=Pusillimonas sp. ANT_WB101 TaxID=2597356 RepID=UPI0011ECABD7|nr:TRAP transporter small permease [Pusillimonas sp. ANT_WB101]KAA0890980.1 TRAP transporter small permease [Pusillimonas sp. ANT_WB101]